jgi:hypothetical protein
MLPCGASRSWMANQGEERWELGNEEGKLHLQPASYVFRQSSGSESGYGTTGSTCFLAYWIRILLSLCKNDYKNLEFYYFVTLVDFLSLKNNVNVPSKSNNQKKLCKKITVVFCCYLEGQWWKYTGSGSWPESGSINQRHGSTIPDPDPHQNIMNAEHCF